MCIGVTELAFQASCEVPERDGISLGSFVTADYSRIRVLVLGPQDAGTGRRSEVEVTLSLEQDQGTPGPLDRFLVGASATVTRVYDVPGLSIGVSARAPSGPTSLSVTVWGRRAAGSGLTITADRSDPAEPSGARDR